MRYLKVLFLLLTVAVHAYRPYVEVDGRFFDFRKGGGLNMWVPVRSDGNHLLFSQAHAGYWRKHLVKFSLGGGYRRLVTPNFGAGVNMFFDKGHSDDGTNYYQGGAGAELFGPCWVFRANGYAPNFRTSVIRPEAIVVGTQVLDNSFIERNFAGFDLEGGYSICFGELELWGYAGYYHFTASGVKPIQGPKARFEIRYPDPFGMCGAELMIGGEWENDRVHGNEGALTAFIRVPIFGPRPRFGQCCPRKSRICRRMEDLVRREQNVWVERGFAFTDGLLGNRRASQAAVANVFFFKEGATGIGTQNDPAAPGSIALDPGDIIFVLSDPGAPALTTGVPITMLPCQQVAGFGDNGMVTLTVQGVPVTFTQTDPDGFRGTINAGGGTGIVLGNDTVVTGIRLTDTGAAGAITGSGVMDVCVQNTNINVTPPAGQTATGPVAGTYVGLTNVSGTVKVSGNTFAESTATTQNLVFLDNTSTNATFTATNNTISATGGHSGCAINTIARGASTITSSQTNNTITSVFNGICYENRMVGGGSLTATAGTNSVTASNTAVDSTEFAPGPSVTTLTISANPTLAVTGGTGNTVNIAHRFFASSATVTGNTGISGGLRGIGFESFPGGGNLVVVTGNTVSGASVAGIDITLGGSLLAGPPRSFSSNTVTTSAIGMRLTYSGTSLAVLDTITSNSITMSGGTGPAFKIVDTPATSYSGFSPTISGNIFTGAATTTNVVDIETFTTATYGLSISGGSISGGMTGVKVHGKNTVAGGGLNCTVTSPVSGCSVVGVHFQADAAAIVRPRTFATISGVPSCVRMTNNATSAGAGLILGFAGENIEGAFSITGVGPAVLLEDTATAVLSSTNVEISPAITLPAGATGVRIVSQSTTGAGTTLQCTVGNPIISMTGGGATSVDIAGNQTVASTVTVLVDGVSTGASAPTASLVNYSNLATSVGTVNLTITDCSSTLGGPTADGINLIATAGSTQTINTRIDTNTLSVATPDKINLTNSAGGTFNNTAASAVALGAANPGPGAVNTAGVITFGAPAPPVPP